MINYIYEPLYVNPKKMQGVLPEKLYIFFFNLIKNVEKCRHGLVILQLGPCNSIALPCWCKNGIQGAMSAGTVILQD